MYIISGHMGGLYVDDEMPDFDQLYCEECGDSDTVEGFAETRREAWAVLKDETDKFVFGEEACKLCQCEQENICEECRREYGRVYGTGGMLYADVANFIYRNFDRQEGEQETICVLAAVDKETGCFYVKQGQGTDASGRKNCLPSVPVLEEEMLETAMACLNVWNGRPEVLGRHKIGNTEYIIAYQEAGCCDRAGLTVRMSELESKTGKELEKLMDSELLAAIRQMVLKRTE